MGVLRLANRSDLNNFKDLIVEFTKFNRNNHHERVLYDSPKDVVKGNIEYGDDLFSRLGTSNEHLFMIEQSNEIVGYVLLIEDEAKCDSTTGSGKYGILDQIFITDKARGKGIGKKAFREAEEWFRGIGINRIKLGVFTWNDTARHLYRNLGYSEYNVRMEKFLL